MNVEFTIKNIKGFGDTPVVFSMDLLPRKINLVYAPNGSGKSSLTAALRALVKGRMHVPVYDAHKKNGKAVCTMSVKLNNDATQVYKAHKGLNQISNILHPFIIDSRLIGKTQNEDGQDDGQVTRGILYVKPITIIDRIPREIRSAYSLNDIRESFGRKKRVLNSIESYLNNPLIVSRFRSILDVLEFSTKARMTSAINSLIDTLNNIEGNYTTLHDRVEEKHFRRIESYNRYQEYLKLSKKILPQDSDSLTHFLFFYQLRFIYMSNKEEFRAAIERDEYEVLKKRFLLDSYILKSPWKKLEIVEENNQLIAKFPQSDEISSGQRDVMILRVLLAIFRNSLSSGYNLLVIDDVFEYLDDANKLVAEYYLKELLKLRDPDIFIVLLSHLEKRSFRTHLIGESDINEVYMLGSDCARITDVKGLTAFREKLNAERTPGDAKDVLYGKMSRFLFHYAPDTEDLRPLIHPYIGADNPGLKEKYGDKNTFYTFLVGELNKYFGNQEYDPYAVATAARIIEEKLLFQNLPDANKQGFIDTFETLKKIEYCENIGHVVPDTYRFITSIHNEADHCTANPDGTFKEKGMVYTLKNSSVKNIVANILGYHTGKVYDVNDLL